MNGNEFAKHKNMFSKSIIKWKNIFIIFYCLSFSFYHHFLFELFSFQQWKLILIFQRQIATNGNKKLKHSPFYFFIKKQKSVFLFHLMKILEINVIYESEWVQSEVVNNKNQYEVKCIVGKILTFNPLLY